MLETLIPILITRVLIPEIISLTKANPTMTDADIIALLPADLKVLTTSNQTFLDSIRVQAGRS